MRGRTLLAGAGLVLAVFTAGLWYTQFHAFYEDLPQQPLIVQGTEYPVETWQGTDASTSPLKRRVCLTVSGQTAQAISEAAVPAETAEPLVAPDWFACFDARQISGDIEAGTAMVYVVGPSAFEGVDDFLALYPDGRGYIWRELQPQYRQ